jgi:hypothetical protein
MEEHEMILVRKDILEKLYAAIKVQEQIIGEGDFENVRFGDIMIARDELQANTTYDEIKENSKQEDFTIHGLVGIKNVWWWNFRKERAETLIDAAVELSEVTIKSRTTKVGWFITETEIHYYYDKIGKNQDFKTFMDVI